jgi:hypothetical protein
MVEDDRWWWEKVLCVQPSVLRPFYTTGWCEVANLGAIAFGGGDNSMRCHSFDCLLN